MANDARTGLSDETLDEISKSIDQFFEGLSRTKGPAMVGKTSANPWPFDIVDVVKTAMAQLRMELGKAWLSNPQYGTRLHAFVRRELEKYVMPNDWFIAVERPLDSLGFRNLDYKILDLTVREYLEGPGCYLSMYMDEMPLKLLNSKVRDLKPDLAIRDPSGVITIWDLTSREETKHLVKTLLYTNLIAHGDGGLMRIGETYWLNMK